MLHVAENIILFFDFLHGEDEDSGSAEADSAVQYPTEEVFASSGRQRPSRRVLGFGGGGGRPAADGATGEATSPATSFEGGDHPAESEGTTLLLEGQHRADTGPLRSSSGDEEVEFHAGAASAEERNITPDSPDASASSRLAWLDNLRCFLIVVVVCYHATGGFVGPASFYLLRRPRRYVRAPNAHRHTLHGEVHNTLWRLPSLPRPITPPHERSFTT